MTEPPHNDFGWYNKGTKIPRNAVTKIVSNKVLFPTVAGKGTTIPRNVVTKIVSKKVLFPTVRNQMQEYTTWVASSVRRADD